jgi:apolipoprotein N-acyltransferase
LPTVERMHGFIKAIALFLAAVLVGASFQPGLWLLSYAGLAIAAVLIEQRYSKLLPAFVAGCTLQLLGVEWTAHSYGTLQNTQQRTLNWLLLGLIFGGAFVPIVLKVGVWLRSQAWPLWLCVPVAWTIGDVARYEGGRLVSGGPYPWLTLGLTQTELVVPCQVADLGGVWAVGFLAAMFAATVVQTVESRRVPAIPVLILVGSLVYGYCRLASDFERGPSLALMPATSEEVPDANFALWSESAFGYPHAIESPAVLLQGIRRSTDEDSFNSLVILREERVIGIYDKWNLVPWSEFMPWSSQRVLTAGDKLGVFDIDGQRVAAAICYDVCFSDYMRQLAREHPDVVVIAANESADPTMMLAHQLLAQSRLRAIEMRRTIVRNANGGYSGIIDGNGRLYPVELDFREPVVLESIPIDRRHSPYVWLGYWLPIGCCLALFVTIARRACLKSVPNSGCDVVKNEVN